jgi:putative membrane protein
MKKQLLTFSVLLSSVALFSCNDNSGSSSTSDTTSTSTTTTSTGTGADTGAMTGTGTTGAAMDTSKMAGTAGTSAANNVGDADKKFMMEAASGGMMEVEAGRLAEQSAMNQRVKDFGTMMVQDHTNANNQLKALASQKNVMLPDSMTSKHRQHLTMLKTKTGKDFDKAYMTMMLTDHNEDVSKFKKQSGAAKDADLKSFASQTLPVLQKHLDSAKAINTMVKK